MNVVNLFCVSPDVWERFPGIKVGLAVIRGVTVQPQHPDLEKLKVRVSLNIQEQLAGKDLGSLPRIQGFRQIYRGFGVDPGSHRPSAEALLRRLLRTGRIYTINTVVDSYNLSSAEFQLPMAAYDLDKLDLPVELRFARAGETHVPIGSSMPDELTPGELVYTDQTKVICRDFNYRDSELTKVTEKTQNLLVFVDACEVVTPTELREATEAVVQRIIDFSGGILEGVWISNKDCSGLAI